ncbi:MAG: hypothetical protein WC752_02075 [Patescibacteria group bacterium]|jgi:hypothetical protein
MEYGIEKQKKGKIDKTDKQIVGIFAFIGIVALIFGFLHFKQSLKDPFSVYSPDLNKKTNEELQMQELLALKTQDSDGDGLTDYDELYQYETSPYIVDSDSDDINDTEEIRNGTNPNCPEGKECLQTRTETVDANSNINGLMKAEDMTAEQLRDVLARNGVPQATLDSMDDATLLQLYKEVITETGSTVGSEDTNSNTSATNLNTNGDYSELLPENTNGISDATSEKDLSALSAAEIKELLIATGDFTENDFEGVSDEQLQAIFQQSLQQQNQ